MHVDPGVGEGWGRTCGPGAGHVAEGQGHVARGAGIAIRDPKRIHLTEKHEDPSRNLQLSARILVQATIYRRIRIGRDGHLNQSEACDIS